MSLANETVERAYSAAVKECTVAQWKFVIWCSLMHEHLSSSPFATHGLPVQCHKFSPVINLEDMYI